MNKLKKYIVNLIPYMARYININKGLDFDLEEQHAEYKDYVMGASNDINWKVIREDGNWTDFLPENERQNIGWESMNCTSFSLMNVLEIMAKAKWGEEWNLSDRYVGALAGTTRRGNSMKKVLETVRKYGVVNEKDYPWKKSWGEYYQKPNQALKEKGISWTKRYNFGYEKVWSNEQSLKEAIKFSPLYVGLYAWYRKGGLYFSVGSPNHASVLAQTPPKIDYDSYDPYVKHLDESFKIPYVYRIYLEKKELEYNTEEIKKLKEKGLEFIIRPQANGEVHKLDEKLTKLTPQEIRDLKISDWLKNKKIVGISDELYNKLLI